MKRKRKTDFGCRSLGRGSIAAILNVNRNMQQSYFLTWREAKKHATLKRLQGARRFGLTTLRLMCRQPKHYKGIFSHYLGRFKCRYLE